MAHVQRYMYSEQIVLFLVEDVTLSYQHIYPISMALVSKLSATDTFENTLRSSLHPQ